MSPLPSPLPSSSIAILVSATLLKVLVTLLIVSKSIPMTPLLSDPVSARDSPTKAKAETWDTRTVDRIREPSKRMLEGLVASA